MAEPTTNENRRARRSTRVSRQLARARERNNRQLVRIRERELQIDQALRDYVAATEQIEAADSACAGRVAQLEKRIRQVRAERDGKIADVHAAQARAVLAIHAAGRTVKQVAELLELSEKAARHLIGQGRSVSRRRPVVSAPAVEARAETSGYRVPDREYEPRAVDDDGRVARR